MSETATEAVSIDKDRQQASVPDSTQGSVEDRARTSIELQVRGRLTDHVSVGQAQCSVSVTATKCSACVKHEADCK